MALTIAVMQTQGLWSWLNAVLVFFTCSNYDCFNEFHEYAISDIFLYLQQLWLAQ